MQLSEIISTCRDGLTVRIYFDEPWSATYEIETHTPHKFGLDLVVDKIWVARDGALCMLALPSTIELRGDPLSTSEKFICGNHA